MAESKRQVLQNGQAVNIADLNAGWETASLADDRVLAELFRPQPYGFSGSNVYKAVLVPAPGEGKVGWTQTQGALVAPSGSADAKIRIYPFRMLVGTRAAASAGAKANWRDIRSGLFVGNTAGDATTLYAEATLTANSSGNPRWDMVYATLSIDASASAVTRKLKNPTSGAVSSSSTVVEVTQNITVTVAAGTPGATPTMASLPADVAGVTYNVLLGYVRVANGFGASSTVATADIADLGATAAQPPAVISSATGAATMFPASVNSSGLTSSLSNGWGSSGTRPPTFLPTSMVGMECMPILLDLYNSKHASGDVIDNSRDWRNRYFLWFLQAGGGGSLTFPSKGAGTASSVLSFFAAASAGGTASVSASWGMGQSFQVDASLVASTRTVMYLGGADQNYQITSPDKLGLYVDASGNLKLYASGTTATNVGLFVWLFATAQMPNF